jgi:hypothetical protein
LERIFPRWEQLRSPFYRQKVIVEELLFIMTGDNLAEPTTGIAGQKRKVSLSSAASKGSKYTLGSAKKVSALPAPALQYLVDSELLQKLTRACQKYCLAKVFKSTDALIKFLKQGLAGTCNMSDTERNEKLFTLFKATVQNPPPSGVGPTDKFEHRWSLPAVGNIKCRLCWGAYYGFSKHNVDECSKEIRKNWLYTGKITSAFSDDTVYHSEYTYEDARGMIVSNLVSEEGSFVDSAGKDHKRYTREALSLVCTMSVLYCRCRNGCCRAIAVLRCANFCTPLAARLLR